MDKRIDELEGIKTRNARVEADKAWEVSVVRRIIISIFIYFVVVIFLKLIEVPYAWSNALVPAVAYFLSTFSLSFLKEWWIDRFYRK